METKTILLAKRNYQLVLDKERMFEWKIVEEKKKGNNFLIKLERDNHTPYYSELVSLEKEYGDVNIPSLLPTIILPIVSIALITIFIVLYLNRGNDQFFFLYFMLFAFTAFVLLILGVVLMFLRLKTIQIIASEKPSRDIEFKKKINRIKNEHI